MDDFIYSNLENYNEEIDVKELRNENRELKCKLEEYAISMDKLQKDFDKVSSEFKKLEMNYSSLLITARAEIERKTQTIAILNKEKDMMILNAISKNKNNQYIRRNFGSKKYSNTSENTQSSKHKTEWREKPKPVYRDSQIERKEGGYISEDTTASCNTDHTSKQTDTEKKIPNYLEHRQRNDDLKENIREHKHTSNVPCKVSSIRDGRKSMPDRSPEIATFSSDELGEVISSEYEFNTVSPHYRNDQYLDINTKDRFEKSFSNKQTNKTYETTSADGKRSNYPEPSSEIYTTNRTSGQYDNRTKYQYESFYRHKRRSIPEISHRRRHGYYADNYNRNNRYGRSDFPRNRVIETPPREKRRNNTRDGYRDYERDRDRDRENQYEYERNRLRRQEKHEVKHKLETDYSEPVNKRMKIESTNEDNRDYKEKEIASKCRSGIKDDEMQYMSCQSPDYMFTENTFLAHEIKVIRNTPLMHLEDPRVSNKNYVVQKDGDKEVLCTVTGDIEVVLKLIDISTWGEKKQDLPNALVNKPMPFAEELVQEIYMDIDNNSLNDSLETGEIVDTEDTLLTDVFAKSYKEDINRAKIDNNDKEKIIDLPKIIIENISDTKKIFKTTKYRIPKVTETADNISSENKSSVNSLELSNKSSPTNVNKIRFENKNEQEVCALKKTVTPVKIVNDKQVTLKDNENVNTKKKPSAVRNIVEGDLILSDDDSVDNNQEITSQIVKEQSNKVSGNSNKKHKIKSKSQKEKAIKPNRSSKAAKVEERVINNKFEQEEKHIKSKFCELFGDSSSLITPEDLELATVEGQSQSVMYIPMFEDAQDSLNFNVDGSKKLETRSFETKAKKEMVDISDNKSVEIKHKFNKAHKETTDSGRNKKSKKNELVAGGDKSSITNFEKIIVENAASNNENEEFRASLCKLSHVEDLVNSENDMYSENKQSELKDARQEDNKVKEPNVLVYEDLNVTKDVVKTVIISTGIQQQNEAESLTDINKGTRTVNDINIINSQYKTQEIDMKVLATSTPHKSCQQSNIQLEESSRSSANNASASSNAAENEDAPDVRIFASRHRRRRIIKKATT